MTFEELKEMMNRVDSLKGHLEEIKGIKRFSASVVDLSINTYRTRLIFTTEAFAELLDAELAATEDAIEHLKKVLGVKEQAND